MDPISSIAVKPGSFLQTVKTPEAAPNKDAEEDEWTFALDYMAAAAAGSNLQFARTTSIDPTASFDHMQSFDGGISHNLSLLLTEEGNSMRDVS